MLSSREILWVVVVNAETILSSFHTEGEAFKEAERLSKLPRDWKRLDITYDVLKLVSRFIGKAG